MYILSYLIKRLGQGLFIVAFTSMVIFTLLRVVPGDPVRLIVGGMAPADVVERVAKDMGLRDPIPVQYARYFGEVMLGDLGRSYVRPQNGMIVSGGQFIDPTTSNMAKVSSLIADRLPLTLALGAAAIFMAIAFAFPLGLAAGLYPQSIGAKLAFFVQSIFVSIPNFWLAIVLIFYLSVQLRWLPALGYQGPSYIFLPAFVLAVEISPVLIRALSVSIAQTMQAEFVTEARVRGLPEKQIILGHGLRNAAVPLMNLLGIQLSSLIGGVLVIEYIFDYPGLGQLTVMAVANRDFPLVQGIAILTSAVFVLINILVDLASFSIDPRVEL